MTVDAQEDLQNFIAESMVMCTDRKIRHCDLRGIVSAVVHRTIF